MPDWLIGQLVLLASVGGLLGHWVWRCGRDRRAWMAEYRREVTEWRARREAETDRWRAGWQAELAAFGQEQAERQAEFERELAAAE